MDHGSDENFLHSERTARYLQDHVAKSQTCLSEAQVAAFIEHGFVALENAFPKSVAVDACRILANAAGFTVGDPTTWPDTPCMRIGARSDKTFLTAASTERLHLAYDQLVGEGRWLPFESMATFPIRLPSTQPSAETDWHVDMSFGPRTSDTMQWRANIMSDGRALLLLFLFSDIDSNEAPTRLLAGSHVNVARLLRPAGSDGLSLSELKGRNFGSDRPLDAAYATGAAGTVYLCHPFLVHAGQDNPTRPRFLGQPALMPKGSLRADSQNGALSPVERAVQLVIDR